MNGFDLSTISSVYVGSTLYSSIYYGSTLLWPILSLLTTGLPSGYKLVEYITGDTNWSFIDTGVLYNANLKVDCVLQDNLWALYGAFFGAYESESSPSFRLIYTNLLVALGYYTAGSIAGQSMLIGVDVIGSKRHIILDKDGVNINGTYTANIRTVTSASLNKNILIGRTSIPSSKPASASTRTIKIYTFKIWNSGTLVFEGIPCIRTSDNTVGLYDTVSRRLLLPYYSDGSFTAGPEIIEIEYLRSSGTLYIDLNIVPDSNTGIYTKIKRNSSYNDRFAIGLRDTSGNTRWCIACSNSSGWYYGYGGYSPINTSGVDLVNEVTLNYLNDGLASSVNTTASKSVTLPTLSFTPLNKIRLFGTSGLNGTYAKFYGDIYEVKISQGSQIVYDLIPVRVGLVGYMYDKISGTLLGNDGTGDFVLGPDKQ